MNTTGRRNKKHWRKGRWVLTGLLITITVVLWMRWRPAQRFNGAARRGNDLRIMTWNVGYFSPVKDKNIHAVLTHTKKRPEEIRIVAGDLNYNIDPEEDDDSFYRPIKENFGDATATPGERITLIRGLIMFSIFLKI